MKTTTQKKAISGYLRIMSSILVLLLGYGVFAPILISSNTDIGIITGIILLVIIPIICFFILKPLIIKAMKTMKKFLILLICAATLYSCSRVEPGYVGVKIKELGQNKGVEPVVLGVGRYWMGALYTLYEYPTFVTIYPFTLGTDEGSTVDEAFRFQTIEGISCNVDLAISCHADPENANILFQTYRKEMAEIIKSYMRQDLSNYFISYASKLRVDELYSSAKMNMLSFAKDEIAKKYLPTGVILDDISYKSDIRFPAEVQQAIIGKIQAIQLATQKQNEIVQAEADAKKRVATAQGEAQSILLVAKAQAEANELLSRSITSTLVTYELDKRWNGISPIYSSTGPLPLIVNPK